MNKRFLISLCLVVFALTAFTGCNNAPEIESVLADPNPASPGQTVTVTTTAIDADNDALTYSLQSLDQADSVFSGNPVSWIAPTGSGSYRFVAVVADGRGGYAYDSTLTITLAANLLPAQDVGTRQATIVWNATDITNWAKYEIYRSEAPNAVGTGTMVHDVTTSRLDTVWTDKDLSPGTEYYYVVATVSSDVPPGRSYSNEITVTSENFKDLGSQGLGGANGVRLASTGNYIFCATLSRGVYGFTITNTGANPGAIISQNSGNPSAWAYDVGITNDSVSGTRLDVAFGTGADAYSNYSIANPQAPVWQASTALNGGFEARAVFSEATNAFLGGYDPASSQNALQWWDVTTPTAPAYVSQILLPDIPTDIYVFGSYIYVADSLAGIVIVHWNGNVSSPALTLINTFATGDAAQRVYVSGQYAYIASSSQGLLILDISNPHSPSLVSQWMDPETNGGNDAQGVFLLGDIAYLADGIYGLRVIDISDISNPVLLYTLDVGTKIMDVWAKSFNTLYQAIVADWNNAIHMIEW